MAKKQRKKKPPSARTKGVKRTTLTAHLHRIESFAIANAASGKEKGACLVTDPQTSRSRCIRTDAASCKALKGTFIGGPCGGLG